MSQGAVICGIEISKLLDEMAAEITSKTCLKGLDILMLIYKYLRWLVKS